MAFKTQILEIMDSPHWKKGFMVSHTLLRRIIIDQLGFTDKRTVAKWLGHEKVTWKRKVVGIGYTQNKKQVEWMKGLLEEFFIIKRLYEEDIEQLPEHEKQTYDKDYAPYFRILKDKSDFGTT